MRASRRGPSERLHAALDALDYPSLREGRVQHFAEDFDVSLSSAHRMLSSDHVPSRLGLKARIAQRLQISPAYWEYGIDTFAEDLVCHQRDLAWAGLLRQLRERDYELSQIPLGLLEQLVRLIYRSAIDAEGTLDDNELQRIVDMSSFMLDSAIQGTASTDQEA